MLTLAYRILDINSAQRARAMARGEVESNVRRARLLRALFALSMRPCWRRRGICWRRRRWAAQLELAGLLVFACPPKRDAKAAMTLLRNADCRLVMITGDATLTAAAVAGRKKNCLCAREHD